LNKFLNDLCLGISRKHFNISQKNFIHFPKFLMTFATAFLGIDLFHVLMCYFSVGGSQIRSRHRYGGQNPYNSTNSQCYHYSFCPRGEPNSIANFDWGAMAGSSPSLDPPLTTNTITTITTTSTTTTCTYTDNHNLPHPLPAALSPRAPRLSKQPEVCLLIQRLTSEKIRTVTGYRKALNIS